MKWSVFSKQELILSHIALAILKESTDFKDKYLDVGAVLASHNANLKRLSTTKLTVPTAPFTIVVFVFFPTI